MNRSAAMVRGVTSVLTVALVLIAGCGGAKSSMDPAKQKAFATELMNRELYEDAAKAYDRYIEMPGVSDEERGKILFHTANMLFDQAKDYHGALLRYLRLKTYYPAFPQRRQVDAKIVQCFERTGRSLEAQLALEQAAALNRQGNSAAGSNAVGGTVVAEVGTKKITERDVMRELEKLPPDLRKQFESAKGKRQFLRQVVGRELFYDTAVRRGYGSDPDIERQIADLRRDLMVQKVMQDSLGAGPEITDTEVQLYYEAHKDDFRRDGAKNAPPLDQVRPQVEAALKQMKRQEAVQKLLDRALSAEEVRLYPERLR